MYKNFFLIVTILIFSINLNANEDKALQIIAQKVVVEGNVIKANGNALIFSPNYYITSDSVKYDKLNKKLELFGNVNISKNNEAITLSNYATLDFKNEIHDASPVLLIDQKSDIWIDAKKIQKISDLNIINDATISSCDCYDPAWSIGFEKGDFNTTKEWVNIYNNTLYIKGIPAWYFLLPVAPYLQVEHLLLSYLVLNPPYLGFSTSNKRESGLLRPKLGYSSSQGYIYAQPIYWAPGLNYDFEYIPQVRTLRGSGHELKYRYKDSVNSRLDMSVGVFNEKKKYYEDNDLLNEKHYGWNLDYERKNIFSNANSNDGLLISLQDMNDIEYKNTNYSKEEDSSDKIIKSEIKYFYNSNNIYADINLLKYDNIYTGDNSEVYQTIPKIQIHKYSNKLSYFDKISSSFDFKFERKTADEKVWGNTSEILLPINYNSYFFDKYLSVNFTEQIKFKNIDYSHDNNTYTDANYLTYSSILNFSIDLLKSYKTFIHTINFNASFTKANVYYEKGDLYGINSTNSELSTFTNTEDLDNINLSINQNFYSKNKFNIVNHKMNQTFLKDNSSYTLGNLENELTYNYSKGSISSRLLYNHNENLIIESALAFKFKQDTFITNIDYSYIKEEDSVTSLYKDSEADRSITAEISDKFFKYYTVKYKEQYNITDDVINLKEYSLNISKKCWDFGITLSDKLVATATTTESAIRQNVIYGTITLKPLIQLEQTYIQDEENE